MSDKGVRPLLRIFPKWDGRKKVGRSACQGERRNDMERIVDIGGYGVKVRAETGWLVVETGTGEKTGVPIRDIAVVVLSTPAAMLSGALLSEVAEAGGVVVVCEGEKKRRTGGKTAGGPLVRR